MVVLRVKRIERVLFAVTLDVMLAEVEKDEDALFDMDILGLEVTDKDSETRLVAVTVEHTLWVGVRSVDTVKVEVPERELDTQLVTEGVKEEELLTEVVPVRVWPTTPAKPSSSQRIKKKARFIYLAEASSKT